MFSLITEVCFPMPGPFSVLVRKLKLVGEVNWICFRLSEGPAVFRQMFLNEFLDLLRSTFPQLGAHTSLEFFTQRQNKRVPLTARTPEEIQEFMNSVDFISALFIQSKEQESVQSSHEDIEVIEDIPPSDQTEPNSMDWEEPDNKERDDVVPIDDQDQVEEAPTEKPVSCTGVQMTQTSLKTLRVEAHLSCQICRTADRSVNKLIKHSYSHMDDPGRLCGVCGHHSESAEELQSHLQKHKEAHIKEEQIRGAQEITATHLEKKQQQYMCN